jgi:hypothetical protein
VGLFTVLLLDGSTLFEEDEEGLSESRPLELSSVAGAFETWRFWNCVSRLLKLRLGASAGGAMVLDMKAFFPFLDAMVSMNESKFGDVRFVRISGKLEEVLEDISGERESKVEVVDEEILYSEIWLIMCMNTTATMPSIDSSESQDLEESLALARFRTSKRGRIT